MHAMGQIFSDDCPRDGCRHTTEHLFWHCTAHAKLRAPFSAAIAKYLGLAAAKGASVSEYINMVYNDVTFRNLGVVPGDP